MKLVQQLTVTLDLCIAPPQALAMFRRESIVREKGKGRRDPGRCNGSPTAHLHQQKLGLELRHRLREEHIWCSVFAETRKSMQRNGGVGRARELCEWVGV